MAREGEIRLNEVAIAPPKWKTSNCLSVVLFLPNFGLLQKLVLRGGVKASDRFTGLQWFQDEILVAFHAASFVRQDGIQRGEPAGI